MSAQAVRDDAYSAIRLAELAVEAGVPAGLFNVVQGDGRTTGDALTRHPRIAKMTPATGSTRTGAAIMATCASRGPKPVTLELGGKSPQLVFDDVPDIDRLAGIIAGAITGNAGQVCVAGSRLIVQRGIAQALIERIGVRFAALRPGATWDNTATLPPIISGEKSILDIVERARDAGAEVRCGGGLFLETARAARTSNPRCSMACMRTTLQCRKKSSAPC